MGGHFNPRDWSFVPSCERLIPWVRSQADLTGELDIFDPIDSEGSVIIAEQTVGSKVPIALHVDRFIRFNSPN
jgi:hypothetical protein